MAQMNKMLGLPSTAPVAAATPAYSGGTNPATGAYRTGLATTPTTPDPSTLGPALDGSVDAYNAAVGPVAAGQPGTQAAASAASKFGSRAPIAAGNGTYGNMGTNLVTPAQAVPGVTGGGSAPVSGLGGDPNATPTYGTESGPGLLDQWFNERATGTDPGWEYATKRGLTALDNGAAARGGYNTGASAQQDSDYLASMGSQREGQLDALATGASGERATSLNTMLGLGTGLAGGEAGLGAAYDIGGANAMSGANNTGLSLGAQGIGLQYGANQNTMNQLMGLGTIAALA